MNGDKDVKPGVQADEEIEAVVHSGVYAVQNNLSKKEVLNMRARRKAEKKARKAAALARIERSQGKGTVIQGKSAPEHHALPVHRWGNWFCPSEGCEYHDHLTPLTSKLLRGKPPFTCPACSGVHLVPGRDNGLPPWYCPDSRRRDQEQLSRLAYKAGKTNGNANNKGGAV